MSAREIEFRGLVINHPNKTGFAFGYLSRTRTRTYIGHLDSGFEVDSETIGQYTGIKDANGVKVFEGDICDDGDGDIFVVAWSKVSAMFFFYFPSGLPDDVLCDAIEPFQVIGNIHQHPELLEVK